MQIDALSKRSKEAEAAFLNVYKKIIDVPGKDSFSVCVCVKFLLGYIKSELEFETHIHPDGHLKRRREKL